MHRSKQLVSGTRQRVIVFADYFEPGYKSGGPVRTLKNMFMALHQQFDFLVVTRNHDIADNTLYDLPYEQWLHKDHYSIIYLPEAKLQPHYLYTLVRSAEPDIIYFNSFFSLWFSIVPVFGLAKAHRKLVLAPRGEFSRGALNIKSLRKSVFLLTCRVLSLYRFVRFHASNEIEAADIRRNIRCREIVIAPDLIENDLKKKRGFHKQGGTLKLCFISRINTMKNLHYCIETIAGLKEDNKNIKLNIYGPVEDDAYWNYCRNLIKKYELGKSITYGGLLQPEYVKQVFSEHDFFFFPTLGENFGHVIFEALSVGTPVILSNNTFWDKSPNNTLTNLIFELDDRQAVGRILKECLYMDNEDYQKLSDDAFNMALAFANESQLLEKTRRVFEFGAL